MRDEAGGFEERIRLIQGIRKSVQAFV